MSEQFSLPSPEEYPNRMVRLFFKDGNYMDCHIMDARYYENDPEWDHTEEISQHSEDQDHDNDVNSPE